MPNICEECETDLDAVMKEMEGEDEIDKGDVLNDCTLHNPHFDPDDYKTWPRGHVGTLIDTAKALKNDL